jgi:type IV pilus assembly protein PilQ
VDLSYAPITSVQTVVRPMLSDRGSITTFTQTQSLLITDIASRLDEILKVIKKLDVATPEIRLEVRIVEASDTFSQELGVNWVMSHFDTDANHGYSGSKSTGGTLSNTLSTATSSLFDSGFGSVFPSVPESAIGIGGAEVVIGLLEDTLRLDVQLKALESMGELEIIESPKIRVLNNVAAEMTITRSIPIRNVSTTTDDDGNVSTESEITTEDIITSLDITPTVSADKKVKLDIELIHTTLGDEVTITLEGVLNTYYITDTKTIDTEVLVNNRDTVVIGGLYRKRKSETDIGLPLLKDIPLLGWLFKTRATSDVRRELLIFVTPTIVRESEGVVSEINE